MSSPALVMGVAFGGLLALAALEQLDELGIRFGGRDR